MVKYISFVVAFLFASGFTLAQDKVDDKPAGNSLPIAIVNVEKIAQQYKPFQKRVATLQEEGKELQSSVALKQSELQGVGNDLQKTAPGSPEQQKLQGQYARLQRELQLFVQEGQQKFREKDLKLSLTLHREIDQVLKPYCKTKGIRLVVRTQNASLEENQNAQQLVQTINRGVLFEDGLDVTDDVLKLMNEKGDKGSP